MPKNPTWRGSTALQLDPNFPEWDFKGDGIVNIKFKYTAPYETCLSNAPTVGTIPVQFNIYGCKVQSPVKVKRGPGGTGTLEFMASNERSVSSPDYKQGDTPTPNYEIEWTQISKPIESHPIYESGGYQELDATDRNKIEEWKAESNAGAKGGLYDGMSAEAKHLADRLIRGQDSYVVYSPVSRITTLHRNKPVTGRCGLIQNPPADVLVDGYEYLKTADRATKQGKIWTQVQEWTGADEIDDDIYDNA